jgi:hypothetical protein
MKSTIYILIIGLLLNSCVSLYNCENGLINEYPNPSKTQKAILFYRDCGATTSKSLQLSLIPMNDKLNQKLIGNVLTCEFDSGSMIPLKTNEIIQINWINDTSLTISLNNGLETFIKKSEFLSVKIKYKSLLQDSVYRLNLTTIKKKYQEFSTSGILSKKEQKDLYKPDSIGFYGFYNLVDSLSMDLCGFLVVYNKGIPKNWKYDNTDDIFILLDYQKGDMTFFNGIKIGQQELVLQEKLKDCFHYKKGTMIHADIDNYSTDLYLDNDTISRIRIEYNYK